MTHSEAPAPPGGESAGTLLLERDGELSSLREALDSAAEGRGRLTLVEGPAGIGKTRLLAELRDGAAERGMRVLTARASELEREFPFGVVRQLFEPALADPETAERWFAAAAAASRPVFDAFAEADTGAEGASFAALHGLYWLTANAAHEQPLALIIDDLHWVDRPSLRFLAYLARRLEGLELVVATTMRSAEPGTDPGLVHELAQDPGTVSVRPGPLTLDGVVELASLRSGQPADRRFATACHQATGGNPLLLGQLLATLRSDGIAPEAVNVGVVREIGPRAVSRTIQMRLGRLPEDAVAVARAIAVLGQSSHLATVAELARIPEERVAAATRELVQTEILRPEPPLGFVHPLVRDAVYKDISPGDRELQHALAAELLRQDGAAPDNIATHLLSVPPRGEAWVAELLLEAARSATRKGAPDSAETYLERALAEPPPRELRPTMLFELGISKTNTSGSNALEHLSAARMTARDPILRGISGLMMTRTLMFTGAPGAAHEMAAEFAAEAPPEMEDLRKALRTVQMTTPFFGEPGRETMIGKLDDCRGTPKTLGDKFLASLASMEWALYSGGGADECVALALASLEGGDMFEADAGLFWVGAMVVLTLAGRDEAQPKWDAIEALAHKRGSLFNVLTIALWRGFDHMHRGNLGEAEDLLNDARRLTELWGASPQTVGYPAAFYSSVLLEKGDLAGARAVLGAIPMPGEDETSDAANFLRRARCELALLENDADTALKYASELERVIPEGTHPAWGPWRSLKAQALAKLSWEEDARALAEAELAIAERWGAPATVGRSLRVLGEIQGTKGLEALEQAVANFERSNSKFEHARALVAFGMALRRARKPSDAREPLRRALDLATSCSANLLAEQARSELYATGARPRSTALGGVEALTDRELKVATLASEGESNRDIAQTLYVTPKTVEVHLTNVYRKLGVGGRRDLPAALTTVAA
jgi:DNA-binding NarL/FixJ family response regulator